MGKELGFVKHVKKYNTSSKCKNEKSTDHRKNNYTMKFDVADKKSDDSNFYQVDNIVEETVEDCLHRFNGLKRKGKKIVNIPGGEEENV